MYSVFLIGNIASGKSTACRYLSSRGARHVDLDTMAKDLYLPGSEIVAQLADAFGWDILDADGGIIASRLADRAFCDAEAIARLNGIVHPVLIERLGHLLIPAHCCTTLVPECPLLVIEVSAPRGFESAFTLADEVIAISAPLEVRKRRALGRGMASDDFDRRAALQPDEGELCAMASTVIRNESSDDVLFAELDARLHARGICLEDADAALGSGFHA